MEKIIDIIEIIACEKGLEIEHVAQAVAQAIVITAKNHMNEAYDYGVDIDIKNKNFSLYQKILVVSDDDERIQQRERYIPLSEARKLSDGIEIGDEARYDCPIDFGRSGINLLHRELETQIQRLIETQLFDKYKSQIGKIVSGTVVRIDNNENTYIEIDEIRAVLPMRNRIKGEKFVVGNVVKSILKYVNMDNRNGISIELSRTTPKFLEELLRLEVPEIYDNEVIIHKCARIPGERSKIAISSSSTKIDPIGATVGVKGIRINAVSKELKNENIDCIEYSDIGEKFVARALAPALISNVKIENKKAIVSLPSEQKSKAIGKNGINIRLATMLTGYNIELVEQNSFIPTPFIKEEKADIDSLISLFKK